MTDYDPLTYKFPRSTREAWGQPWHPNPIPDVETMFMVGCSSVMFGALIGLLGIYLFL